MAAKIRCHDEVIILTGKNKGKRGKVKQVFTTGRAIVSGINIIKKHHKSVRTMNQPGYIVEKEATIHISNLALFNTAINKGDRIRFRTENGKKVRIFKSNDEIIN
ncbi:50S ribosomal protein L24 [Candidatus Palibaumannia cicadellinicola]|uniref:Large ribosomal subunit protein uL24 n=1 Tax=Candidatus Palibaumannia cicadellinicola TaxID=186490 RepID=A0A2N4XXA0_9GAMM|nr:50S ribosomal protein L24 [Candidatus Baumannia cicadellinicola]PLK59035.1 50S ribosomal protein L24 [Candidatus Baumannia cicadellinicola]